MEGEAGGGTHRSEVWEVGVSVETLFGSGGS